MKQKAHGILKLIFEYAPLVAFFISYKISNDFVMATKYLMASSVISISLMYLILKSVPKIMLYSAILIIALGLLTVIFNDPTFVKIKPTILYLFFAAILAFGLCIKKILFKNLFEKNISLTDEEWKIFTKRCIYFLIFAAILNELVWRNFSDYFWIKFKLFGMPICTFVFLAFNAKFFVQDNNKK
ncbi:MAG: septation protein IspZ [Pseudomonadota bacterium]